MTKRTLDNKVIVVAGGANNLGSLICKNMAKYNTKILVHYYSDSSKSDAEATVKAVQEAGSEAIMIQSDLTQVANVEALFEKAKSEFGQVDVAINTAGMVLKKPIIETSEAEYDEMFAVNSKAAYFFIKEAGRQLEDNGTIITISTSLLAAFTGLYSTYAGAKAPVDHFTRAAAKEFAEQGISVTSVAPGPMDTPFFYPQESEEAIEFHKSQTIGKQLTKIEDIVPIVEFLATDGWWITGQTIFANGGYATR